MPAATLDLNAIDSPKLLQQGQSDQPPIPHPEHVAHSPRPTPGPDFPLPPTLPISEHPQARAPLRCLPATSGTLRAQGPGHLHRFPSILSPLPQPFCSPATHFTLVSLPPTFLRDPSALSATYTQTSFPPTPSDSSVFPDQCLRLAPRFRTLPPSLFRAGWGCPLGAHRWNRNPVLVPAAGPAGCSGTSQSRCPPGLVPTVAPSRAPPLP